MDFKEFKKMMTSARNAYIKAQQKEQEVLAKISAELGDMDLGEFETFAENAENFEEAILCFLQYGEYSVEELWNELGEHSGSNRGTD